MRYVIIGVILILSLFGALFFFKADAPPTPSISAGALLLDSGEITVGKNVLTEAMVEEEYAKVPESIKADLSKEELAEQLINKELLLAQAEKEGISVSAEETEQAFQQFLSVYQMSEEQFSASLDGMTIEEVKSDYQERLTVSKLIEAHVALDAEVSDSEVDAQMASLEADLGEDVSVFREKVRKQMQVEKQAELAKEYINQLRGDADLAKME